MIPSPVAVGGANRVEVAIPELDNPASNGPHTISVGTSSDGARSIAYAVSAPTQTVAHLSLSLTTAAARATEVTYSIGFTTSVNGALAANSGTIAVRAPPGTFPANLPAVRLSPPSPTNRPRHPGRSTCAQAKWQLAKVADGFRC